MPTSLLEKLSGKVSSAVELIEFLRLQIEELEEKNISLQSDNTALKQRQIQWEQSLASLVQKLEGVHLNLDSLEKKPETAAYKEKEEAVV